jgi:stage V sporulation protein AB
MPKGKVIAGMYLEHVFLGLVGLAAGLAVAAGTFAFLIVIGVVTRMIGKSDGASKILRYESAIILGGIVGCILSVFTELRLVTWPFLSSAILILYGLSAGMFVGGIAVSLAEILDTFPIVFRRIRLKSGLFWIVSFMALGKMTGALVYFLLHF